MVRDYFAEEISAPTLPKAAAPAPKVTDFYSEEIESENKGPERPLIQSAKKMGKAVRAASLAGPLSWGYKAKSDPETLEGGMRLAGEVLPVIPQAIPFNVITNMAIQAQETGADVKELAKSAVKALPFGRTAKTLVTRGPGAVLDQESLTEPLDLKPPRQILFNVMRAINPEFKEPKSDDPLKQIGIDLALDAVGGIGPGAVESAGFRGVKALQTAANEAEALAALKALKNHPERKARIKLKFKDQPAPAAEPVKAPLTEEAKFGTPPPGWNPNRIGTAADDVKLPQEPVPPTTVEVKVPTGKSVLKARRLAELKKAHPDLAEEADVFLGAAKKQQPIFNAQLAGIAEDMKLGAKKVSMPDGRTVDAVTIGNVKSTDSLMEKVLRKRSTRPEYGVGNPKDHVRGSIFLDDFKQVDDATAAIKRRFPDAVIEDTRAVPLNQFGYRGINVTTKMADGVNAEIQVHTPKSWALKLKSDKIYDKWRDFDGTAFETASKQKRMAYLLDRKKSKKIWTEFWNKENQAANLAASSGDKSLASVTMPKVIEPSGTQTPSVKTKGTLPEASGATSTILPSPSTTKSGSILKPSIENITAAAGKSKGKLSPKDSLLLAVENAKTRLAANGGETPKNKLTVKFKTPGGAYEIKNTPEALAEFQKRMEKGINYRAAYNFSKGSGRALPPLQNVKLNNELGFARIPGASGPRDFSGMSEAEIRAEVNRLIGERLNKVKPGDKERKFITSVSKAEKTKPEVATGVEGTYTPITNKGTLEAANKLIKENFEEAYKVALSDEAPTAFSNAVAQRMVDELQNTGRFDDAIAVVENTARKATAQGQAIQALSMYSRLTPEGVLRFAQKTLDKASREITGSKVAVTAEQLKQLPKEVQDIIQKTKGFLSEDQLKKLPANMQALLKKNAVPPAAAKQLQKLTLTKPLVSQLQGLAAKIQAANTPRQRAIATAQLLKAVANQTPASVWKKISAIQTIAQLLNLKTAGRNIIGNVGFSGLENVSDATAAAFDRAVSLATGQRSKVMPNLKVQFRGAARGFREGVEDVKLGINTSGNPTQYNLPAPGIFKSKVGQSFEKMLNYELQVPDRMAYTAAYRESLLNQMKAAKAIKPTDEMLEIAHHDGLYRTFQDDNAITKVFTGIKKALNAGGEFGLGDAILKYPKTPANILARGIEYSPAGFIKSMLELGKGVLGHGFNQKNFVESAARAFVGTNLIGTGILMARLGLITGRKKESSGIVELKKKIGLGDYKLNVSGIKRFVMSGFDPDEAKLRKGDVLKTYDWFLPQAIGVAIGANIEEGKGGPGSTIGTLADAVASGTRTLAEQPLVSGLQRAFGYGDIVGGIGETLKGVPASFAPTLLRQVGMLVDDIRRNPDSEDPIKESLNLVRMKLPGFSKGLPARTDPFGDEVHYLKDSGGPAGKAFSAFVEPANTSKYGTDPATPQAEELIKYGVNVTKQGKSIRGIALTEDEKLAIDKVTGPMAKKLLGAMISSAAYKALDDEKKEKALQAAVRAAKTVAETKNAPAIAKRFLGEKKAA